MNKVVALILAILSGLYLAIGGPLPDPIPFIDEGLAFMVLLNSLAVLGLDLRRFVGMKGKDKKMSAKQDPIDLN